ncbi:MAG: ParB/RepB/Spo0J family partition protein [Clostridiales bacterium]|nr:ParB/RepB/Spo0J family partition protein [Clostridiales bacterium]
MPEKRKGLGRGIDSLFADNSVEEISPSSAVKLNINEIEPNRSQPRKHFDETALSELADSISRHGVLQPIVVRPLPDGGYQLVAGERRWRASRMAGLSEVPVVVKELSDSDAAEIALVENLQREDLDPIEQAEGIQLLMSRCDYTQEQAAKVLGCSRPAVANTLRLLNLPADVREMVSKGALSPGHARALLSIGDEALMRECAKLIVKYGLSVREAEKRARSAAPVKRTVKKEKRDVYFDEVELSLAEALGRRVSVKTGTKSSCVEIEFFGKDDLKSLIALFDED